MAMLNSLPSSSSSESSSSSDESEREERSKCENFCEVIEGYNENEFEAHMRLRRSTVEFLIEKYASSAEPRMNYGGRESVPPKEKLFIYIWYISNTNEMSEYNLQDEPIEDNYHANGNRRDLLFEYLQEHNLI
ncbi:PREDICTED: uncharacterized protein LOC108366746 [Rhagoletis zephyria]|uniref:uncharacterized protein LOC108366746 n=1 Tax=Rhagoletis zephyria TaxID=28612 RepID=UPI0008119E97|nr:PREDICTED: uncharacterized protein LOC108366746 [Rhagoletis zephyria]